MNFEGLKQILIANFPATDSPTLLQLKDLLQATDPVTLSLVFIAVALVTLFVGIGALRSQPKPRLEAAALPDQVSAGDILLRDLNSNFTKLIAHMRDEQLYLRQEIQELRTMVENNKSTGPAAGPEYGDVLHAIQTHMNSSMNLLREEVSHMRDEMETLAVRNLRREVRKVALENRSPRETVVDDASQGNAVLSPSPA